MRSSGWLLALLVFPFFAEAEPPSAAVKMHDLFARLRAAGESRARVRFELTEAEINEYMRYSLRTAPRPGVEAVAVRIFGGNYVSTLATVDFDAVERWKPGTVPVLLRPVLNGRRCLQLDCRFRAADGKGTFTVEKAYFEGIRLPAFFVAKLIEIVAARQPERYDTTRPVPLPFGLRRVWTAGQTLAGEN